MHRNDLFAITHEDLESYANRGTLKRALRDLEKVKSLEDEILTVNEKGDIRMAWEGAIVTLLSDDVFSDSHCSCPSTRICRHMLLMVLLYQMKSKNEEKEPPIEPWDPGAIDDQILEKAFGKACVNRAEKKMAKGILVKLTRGVKPVAYFENLGIYLKFIVPMDPKYVHSDMTDLSIDPFVVMAVKAFRSLPPDRVSGYFSNFPLLDPPPEALLETMSHLFVDMIVQGIAYAPHLSKRLKQLILQLKKHHWINPAANVTEIVEEIDRYEKKDALFEAERVTAVLGEVLLRAQAIGNASLPIPEILVRGEKLSTKKSLDKTRYTGLGSLFEETKDGVLIKAFFFSDDTGAIVTVKRRYIEDEDGPCLSYAAIGDKVFINRHPIGKIAGMQVISSATRKSPKDITLARNAAATPQKYEWHRLKAPLLMASFNELIEQMTSHAASAFRSLDRYEDFFVIPVKKVKDVIFDMRSQRVVGSLFDEEDCEISLRFNYTERGKEGVDALLSLLSEHGDTLRFIAGRVTKTDQSIEIEPISLVYEVEGRYHLFQPFTDVSYLLSQPQNDGKPEGSEDRLGKKTVQVILADLKDLLSELILTGVHQAGDEKRARWTRLTRFTKDCGLITLYELMHHTTGIFDEPLKDPLAYANCLKIFAYLRLASDVA